MLDNVQSLLETAPSLYGTLLSAGFSNGSTHQQAAPLSRRSSKLFSVDAEQLAGLMILLV